jgi:hypothetical protein
MKNVLSQALLAVIMTLAISLPAWSSDAPAKAEPAASKPEASAQAEKDAKPAVTPHNHMRDGKGNWVPAKKTRKDNKKAGDAAAKAAEPAPAQK